MNTNAYTATHDALTHLPNEFLFMDRLKQIVGISERGTNLFAVLITVPDNFNKIYDDYGQDLCDKLLLQIAERLQDTVREPDTITRRKDNAFEILIPQIENPQSLTKLINRIRNAVSQPYQIASNSIHITFSLGEAIYPYDGSSAESLLQHAESILRKK